MTTRERIDLLARAYPQLFPRAELVRLVQEQLGDVDALDTWVMRGGTRVRAWAPETILHICAGNLAVSACTSIMHGLLLGAFNIVKLPGDRHDSSVRREIVKFVLGLPRPLRRRVETHRDAGLLLFRRATAVIAFGTMQTMNEVLRQATPRQMVITHGPATSLLWIGRPERMTAVQARACAVDVLTYDQLGCLSPQAIYVRRGSNVAGVGDKIARALETQWRSLKKKPARPIGVAARIAEARDVAFARGHRVWLPPTRHLGWTLIFDPDPVFQPSPLHGVITIRQVSEAGLKNALAPVDGKISTVGVVGEMSSRAEAAFLSLRASRFCPAGRMQFPPLTWHHDGRKTLADLVYWIDSERRK
jgi:hypothetical protein